MKAAAMKTIHVKDAVGSVLCHDITRIVPGGDKGPVFRKGHIVREEDIQTLLEVGKEHLYVYEPQEGVLHENEAARRIAAATAGANITLSEPKEGRINYSASCMGLLRVDVPTLTRINSLGEITLATLHSMQQVRTWRAPVWCPCSSRKARSSLSSSWFPVPWSRSCPCKSSR